MDLKYAFRSLRKSPGFTTLAILVMALGIGANTAVFSVVNTVLLKPLDYRDPDRIVSLQNYWKNTGNLGATVSGPDFKDWHDESTAFEAMAYYGGAGPSPVGISTTPEYVSVARITPEFFKVFGVDAIVGRQFTPEEFQPNGPTSCIISYNLWKSHFGGNANVLGKTVRAYDKRLTIVGVMPPGFRAPSETDLWYAVNSVFTEATSRSAHNNFVVARLKPDTTIEQARAQMDAIASRLEKQYPPSNQNKGVQVFRMRDNMVRNVKLMLWVMLGAVGAVLLIACANVANLLLARAMSRTREIAIRAAVGASRKRIVRQLVTESLVLAVISAITGVVLAIWGADALVALAPSNVPRLKETRIDFWVLAFTLGLSIAASLVFGLAPALQASKVDLNESLKQGANKVLGGGAGRMRNGLVIAEIALSTILLIGAGLLIRSFHALTNVELGFKPEKILVMRSSIPTSGLDSAKRATETFRTLLSDIASVPGASAVGATNAPPGTIRSNGGYWIDRLPQNPGVTSPQAVFTVVAPGAFSALGIPLRTGRDFDDSDGYDAPFTAIINEALAKKSFDGQDPIGRIILCGMDSPNPMKIVGVVGDVRQSGPAGPASPQIYMPYRQHPYFASTFNVLVRTANDTPGLADVMRRKARERSTDMLVSFTTMEAALSQNVAAPRFRTLLLGVFAGLAVCLAMAGVYGVMSYSVGQRMNEIGLRVALGADAGNVLWLVLRQALILAGIGAAIGLAGSVAASRLLESMLFNVKKTDLITYICAALLLGLVAVAASYIPARRAMKVDPIVALRQD